MAAASSVTPSPFAPNHSTGNASARAPTLMKFELPVMEDVALSVAVIVWLPPVVRMAEKILVPDSNVESAGSCTWGSVLVKCTVPE
jgi:hypothetical protein